MPKTSRKVRQGDTYDDSCPMNFVQWTFFLNQFSFLLELFCRSAVYALQYRICGQDDIKVLQLGDVLLSGSAVEDVNTKTCCILLDFVSPLHDCDGGPVQRLAT